MEYKGITYANNEAAFQAQKDPARAEEFACLTPNEAKRLGRRVQLRADWEDEKVRIMYEIVKAKFNRNPDLRMRLITTGDSHLEEGNTWGDKTWGTVEGVGSNLLGRILMKVREELGGAPDENTAGERTLFLISRGDGKWYGGYERSAKSETGFVQLFNTDHRSLFSDIKQYTDKGYAVKCLSGAEAKVFMANRVNLVDYLKGVGIDG